MVNLEAVLDQEVVLPAGGSSFGVILQQDKQLFGQLVGVLLHGWKRELQQPGEGHQRLRDHLRVGVKNELRHRLIVGPGRCGRDKKTAHLHVHGVETVEQQRDEGIEHLQG